jgi:hypothetical protein
MKLAGSPRTVFGVCANEWSPDDGRVVSVDHGCGAHSETRGPEPASLWQSSEPVVNERDLEVLATTPVASADSEDDGAASTPAEEQPDAGDQTPADVPAEIAGEQEAESAADAVADSDTVADPGSAADPDAENSTTEDGSTDQA